MRFLTLFTILSLPLISQTRESGGETIQTLLAEVRQLRFAIERSTLLGTRMQIALQRIQAQEARTSRLLQELENTRRELTNAIQVPHMRLVQRAKELEQVVTNATDASVRRQMEAEMREVKMQEEMLTTREQQVRARETEMSNQVRDAQARLTELHDRVNQMERALDDSLRQIGGR
jgi:hypothetical protein